MADDGEKFGVWPETYRTVYEEGWLDRFFTLSNRTANGSRPRRFPNIAKRSRRAAGSIFPRHRTWRWASGRCPTRAMKEYDDALAKVKGIARVRGLRPFIKGGIWRNFLAKYSESNHMHKRMLMVSRKVRRHWLRSRRRA